MGMTLGVAHYFYAVRTVIWCAGVVNERVYKLGRDVAVVEGEPGEAMDIS